MAEDQIRYDTLAQEALRDVIRKVLVRIEKSGLPGEHHLYVAFDTRADGVFISERLHEQYPEEMTIVLQYQFWDLKVSGDRFEVKLSFNNIPERLVVPFAAIKAFYDPSVQFGLQFGAPGADNDALRARPELPAIVNDEGSGTLVPDSFELSDEPAEPAPPADERPDTAARVVELDSFRKK